MHLRAIDRERDAMVSTAKALGKTAGRVAALVHPVGRPRSQVTAMLPPFRLSPREVLQMSQLRRPDPLDPSDPFPMNAPQSEHRASNLQAPHPGWWMIAGAAGGFALGAALHLMQRRRRHNLHIANLQRVLET